MDINATILGQCISFAIFVWFTMKFVWPTIRAAIDEREQVISNGLQNAEQASASLANAQEEAKALLNETKRQSAELIEKANRRANQMIEKAKGDAVAVAEKEKEKAAEEILRQAESAKNQLRQDVANLAVLGAEQILRASVDKNSHAKLLEQLSSQL